MGSNTGNKISAKFKWTNIGIMLHETSEFRRLIGLGISSDGGVMLSPSKSFGNRGWEYGFAHMPGRRSRKKVGLIHRETVLNIDETPKMHFHKSGEAAISLTGRTINRMQVQLKPIEKFKGEQFFSLNVDRPDLLPISQVRKNDIYFVAHNYLPTAIGVCGFLCPKSRIDDAKQFFFTEGSGIGFIPDGDVETLVIDLSFRGIDFYFSVRFSVFNSALPEKTEMATSRLFAVDRKVHSFRMNKLLGLWTPDHVNPTIPMFTLKESPFARIRTATFAARDLKRIIRGPEGVVSEQLWNEGTDD